MSQHFWRNLGCQWTSQQVPLLLGWISLFFCPMVVASYPQANWKKNIPVFSAYPVQVYTTASGDVIELPIVLPSAWLKTLLTEHRFLLQGGHGKNIHEQLKAFWDCYSFCQPDHKVYEKNPERLPFTIPVLVHGDEGRYLKKGNFMICTVECVLGSDSEKMKNKKPCTCHADPILNEYYIGVGHAGGESLQDSVRVASGQIVNDSGNEFLSKFLIFGMSSLVYKKHKGLLNQAFDMVAADLTHLHHHGFQVGDQTFYAATIGVKGDLKFHHQVGNLSRSYYNVGTKMNRPMCSLCLAGRDDIPFEDVSATPAWIQTMYQERPWAAGETPSLATIPFTDTSPEEIFRLDLFHCFKCGLGRDLTGSTTILLCQLEYFDSEDDSEYNLPARLERAHGSFVLWCKACGKPPALHSFSKSLLNFKNEQSFAWFNVKGSDNTLLTAWLLFVVKLSVESNGYRYPRLEAALIETFTSAVVVFEVLHSHKLWLERFCAQRVQHHLTVIVRGYKVLAHESKSLRRVGYGLKPKLHACDHLSRDLERQLKSEAPRVLNPMAYSCEANESMVGHVSRLARRVSSRTVGYRVLERVRIKVKSMILKMKSQLRFGRKLKPKHVAVNRKAWAKKASALEGEGLATANGQLFLKWIDLERLVGNSEKTSLVRNLQPLMFKVYIYIYIYIYYHFPVTRT